MTEIQKNITNTAQSFVDAINKAMGSKDAVKDASTLDPNHEWLETGFLTLDDALGGGFPMGRIVEIVGFESSGKTTIATYAMIAAQNKGLMCGFVDMEHSFDMNYAETLGLSPNIVYTQPMDGEEALEIAEKMITNGVKVVVIDSIAALVPRAEVTGEMGEAKMGLMARLMGQALRKISPLASKHGALVIFINQYREKITIYGDPKVTPGGNAMKFYASQRLDVSKKLIKDSDASEQECNVKVFKNKVGIPLKVCNLVIRYGEGIDKAKDTLEYALLVGALEKKASYYYYNNEKIAQGEDNTKQWILENPDFEEYVKTFKIK